MSALGTTATESSTVVGTIRRILIPIFLAVLLIGAGGFYFLVHNHAIQRASDEARLILNTAMAIRSYTDTEIAPVLAQLQQTNNRFYEAMVPSFAAQSVYRAVQDTNPIYTYREPALNPTSPRDRPTPFEVELINKFRADEGVKELRGIREGDSGAVFYLARPIKITKPECLQCHTSPEMAPPAMVAKYGSAGGFGWKLNEIVGVQTLTVPIAEELRGTIELTIMLAAGLLVLFLITYASLHLALHVRLVRPLRDLARAADESSKTGDGQVVLPNAGSREIQDISNAIRRLRISLMKALGHLSAQDPKPQV